MFYILLYSEQNRSLFQINISGHSQVAYKDIFVELVNCIVSWAFIRRNIRYYIPDSVLVIFEGNKNGIFPRENIPFRYENNSV